MKSTPASLVLDQLSGVTNENPPAGCRSRPAGTGFLPPHPAATIRSRAKAAEIIFLISSSPSFLPKVCTVRPSLKPATDLRTARLLELLPKCRVFFNPFPVWNDEPSVGEVEHDDGEHAADARQRQPCEVGCHVAFRSLLMICTVYFYSSAPTLIWRLRRAAKESAKLYMSGTRMVVMGT